MAMVDICREEQTDKVGNSYEVLFLSVVTKSKTQTVNRCGVSRVLLELRSLPKSSYLLCHPVREIIAGPIKLTNLQRWETTVHADCNHHKL